MPIKSLRERPIEMVQSGHVEIMGMLKRPAEIKTRGEIHVFFERKELHISQTISPYINLFVVAQNNEFT